MLGDNAMATVMAKRKSGDGKPGPKPDPSRVRDAVTLVRSRQDWKAAVEEAAEFDRAPSVADFIDRAVAHYCRQIGFPKALPKR
jgi:hypothetical protein